MNNIEDGSEREFAMLLTLVAEKNRDAFEKLYDVTTDRVYSLAMSITRQQTLAEEVVSDVFFHVWQKAHDYKRERGPVIAWLCVLCRSRALDALRRGNTAIRQAEVNLDAMPEQADSVGPCELLEAYQEESAIHRALAKLTPDQQQLLTLAYFRGHTHIELATITGMPIGTVKTNIHRAMKILKQIMEAKDEIGEPNE